MSEQQRDPYTGHPIEVASDQEASRDVEEAPIERTIRVTLTSVHEEMSERRFLASVVDSRHLSAASDTPGRALAALGEAIDADLVNTAWNAWVPPDGSAS